MPKLKYEQNVNVGESVRLTNDIKKGQDESSGLLLAKSGEVVTVVEVGACSISVVTEQALKENEPFTIFEDEYLPLKNN